MTKMNFSNFSTSVKGLLFFGLFSLVLVSCGDDEPLLSSSFDYSLHNGEVVETAPYGGSHDTDFSASIKIDEMENGNAMVSVTLNNTMDGMTYHTHAHDGADAASTPNGTPYIETPNSDVYQKAIEGTGGSVTVSQESTMSYTELVNTYEGFFVVHDPLQAVSTTDIGTYLVVGSFGRDQGTPANLSSSTFNYDFNTGQLVADFAYAGSHDSSLGASIRVDELAGNKSRIVVSLTNTMDGETYATHAHDMADPATTPNMTPYIETPNGNVFAGPITGNGGTASRASVSDMSYEMITANYDGFVVVHDPLQAVSTTDPTTYVILGVFAR